MRILFDNGTPRGVAAGLPDHTVKEARSHGWDTLRNGELLDAAEAAGRHRKRAPGSLPGSMSSFGPRTTLPGDSHHAYSRDLLERRQTVCRADHQPPVSRGRMTRYLDPHTSIDISRQQIESFY